MELKRFKISVLCLLSMLLLANTSSAASFADDHTDASLSGWTVQGTRQWQAVNSCAAPVTGSSNPGFLINSTICGPDGTLETVIKSDQWSGYNGGVVFRWTSPSSFYFVSILPGSRYSSYIKLIKNTLDVNSSSARIVGQKFAMNGNYTLKIKMQGSTFQFFIDDILRGTITDASLPSGKIGYGYSTAWHQYIAFDRIQWMETISPPLAPSNLIATAVSASQINLSWKDNAFNERTYLIERTIDNSGTFYEIYRYPEGSTSLECTGLTANTLYKFRVRAVNSAGYSPYSPIQTAQTFVQREKFLIIVSNPLYRTGTIAADLAQYQQDILREGWTSRIITVNKIQDATADFICPTEVQLKNVINGFHQYGLNGFVIVGSPRDIPTTYWRYHEHDTVADPCDLYYAQMNNWVDLNGDGVYETYHSKLVNGEWVADDDNPINSYPNPDLMFGRISPDTTITLISDQAILVSKYFLKIHNYRANGSNLTPDQRARALYLANDYYDYLSEDLALISNITYARSELNVLAGYTLLFPERIKAELRKGFTHAQFLSNSGSDTLYTYSWKDEKRTAAGFTLNDLKAANAKIAQVNLHCPSAARFTVPNFAETFIFNSDYTLNVTGSTGAGGTLMQYQYYDDLNNGLPIGKAFLQSLQSGGYLNTPKVSLHGDPLLCYTHLQPNHAPVFSTKLNSHEATAGSPFSMNIAAQGEYPCTITLSDLPEGARFDGTTLTWTPSVNLAGTSDTIIAKVTDSHEGSCEQPFTVYVSHFKNGILEDTLGWATQGNGYIERYGRRNYYTPYGLQPIELYTSDTWLKLSQVVQVKPNTRYRLSFWVQNPGMTNIGAFVRVDELNQNFAVPVTTGGEFTYVKGVINTGDRTSLTVSLNNGTSSSPTSGNVSFTMLRLVEGGN